MKYKFYKEHGVLECFAFSVENSKIEEAKKIEEQKEKLGLDNLFNNENALENICGIPIKVVLNFNSFGGVAYFTENEVELYKKENFVESVYVEFENEKSFVLLLSFDEFKKIYFDFIGIDVKK